MGFLNQISKKALVSMGAGLPFAIAASLIYPERKIIAVRGDGGFMMNSQELETALRLKLSMVVLILCRSAYGMIKWKQTQMGFVNFGLDFNNPDFVKYAESYSANGYRMTASKDLATILTTCFAKSGVHVIEVAIDYSDNDKVMG
jgi:acetolactate synthase I/II/III large subunit